MGISYITFERRDPKFKYVILKKRLWGQPRISKPQELKGVKPWESIPFGEKSSCQVFIKDKDAYIHHRDWFSSYYTPSKDYNPITGMNGLIKDFDEHFAPKYGLKPINKERAQPFIYNDSWGSIVFRNEAWVKLQGIIGDIEADCKVCDLCSRIAKECEKANGFKEGDLNADMIRFYNDVVFYLFKKFKNG